MRRSNRMSPAPVPFAAIALAALPLLSHPEISHAQQATRSGEEIYQAACAACHDPGGIVPATAREVIGLMSADAIFTILDRGMMSQQASGLTETERRVVADYLSGIGAGASPSTAAGTTETCSGAADRVAAMGSESGWHLWGAEPGSTRFQDAGRAGLTAEDVPGLQLQWVFALPGVTQMRSQPAAAGGRVFVAAVNGAVHALEARSGCELWSSTVAPPARGGLTVVEIAPGSHAVIVPGQSGNVHALDVETGAEIWRVSVSDHPRTALTGTPLFHEGRLYVPISAVEVFSALDSGYECCTFRGGVVALDASDGSTLWRYHTISETPAIVGATEAGTPIWAPSGAPVWSSPTLDPVRRRLYIGTGENYTHPTTETSDAIHALDIDSGRLRWHFQATEGDAWNMACGGSDAPAGFPRSVLPNCPEDPGPDFDFGMSPMIVPLADGREVLVAGQKSGMVFGLDPDDEGAVLWQTRVGRGGTLGGVHWGMAADGTTLFAPVSDRPDGNRYPDPARPGVVALSAATGAELWFTPASASTCAGLTGCFRGYSAPATAIEGAVFAGSLDGHLRAFATADGALLWEFNTVQDFDGVNGVEGRGGAFDVAGPVVAGGMVFAVSGYSTFGQMPGNVLLAFAR